MQEYLCDEYNREVKQKGWVSYNFLTCHMAKAKHMQYARSHVQQWNDNKRKDECQVMF